MASDSGEGSAKGRRRASRRRTRPRPTAAFGPPAAWAAATRQADRDQDRAERIALHSSHPRPAGPTPQDVLGVDRQQGRRAAQQHREQIEGDDRREALAAGHEPHASDERRRGHLDARGVPSSGAGSRRRAARNIKRADHARAHVDRDRPTAGRRSGPHRPPGRPRTANCHPPLFHVTAFARMSAGTSQGSNAFRAGA